MTEDEMKLDMLVAELDYENRLLRARNDRLTKENECMVAQIEALKATVDAHTLAADPNGLRSRNERQEPVAWMIWTHGPVRVFVNKDEASMEFDRLNHAYPAPTRMLVPLYTSPPASKPWMGLDAADWNKIGYTTEFRAGADWADAILREKNQ